MHIRNLIPNLDQMSVEQRLTFVEEIWNSIADEASEMQLTLSQKKDLDARLADHEQNPDDVIAWEDLEKELAADL